MTSGPWYNTSICKKLHGKVFAGYIINARTERYHIMWYIDAHGKEYQSSCDDGSSGVGCPLPSNSTTEALYSLGATINFINSRLKSLEHNFIERCNIYAFNMKNTFQKIPVELPKQPSPGGKKKYLLHAIGGGLYVNNLGQKLTPLKKREKEKKPKIGG